MCLQAYAQLEAALNLGRALPRKRAGQAFSGSPPPQALPSKQHVQEVFRTVAARRPYGLPEDYIGTDQLQELLEELNVTLDESQLAQSVAQLDPNMQGHIPMTDFIMWIDG